MSGQKVSGHEEADARSAVRLRASLAVVGLVLSLATAAWAWWGVPDSAFARGVTAVSLLIALTAAIDLVVLRRRSRRD